VIDVAGLVTLFVSVSGAKRVFGYFVIVFDAAFDFLNNHCRFLHRPGNSSNPVGRILSARELAHLTI
jgi:hypothetical protein